MSLVTLYFVGLCTICTGIWVQRQHDSPLNTATRSQLRQYWNTTSGWRVVTAISKYTQPRDAPIVHRLGNYRVI